MERRRKLAAPQRAILFMFALIAFSGLSTALTVESRVDYSGWKVLQVVLEEDAGTSSQVLSNLQAMEESSYLEILHTRRDKGVAEVAVSPQALEDLRQQQQKDQITFFTTIQDLGKVFESNGPSFRAEPLTQGMATFERYMDLDEILAHVEELPNQFPDKVQLKKVGDSFENRPLYLVTITSNVRRNAQKPIIFIDGGVHAREWISPAAALNLIGRLVESPTLTRNIEWQIMPMVNPDGYSHSWTKDRLWRKNRSKSSSPSCTGTDLNRNFGHHWGETGSSDYECSSIFRGIRPFSEPESRALRDTMTPVKDRIKAYVSIHSYGQYILYPWGYTATRSHANEVQLLSLGKGMAKAIQRNDGTTYSVGSAAKLLYAAAGASDDWAGGELKIPIVYTMELRDEGDYGFVLPAHLIKPAVNDAWLSMKYLAKQIIKKEGLKVESDLATLPAEPILPQVKLPPTKPVHRPAEPQQSAFESKPVSPPGFRVPAFPPPAIADPVLRQPSRPIYQRPVHRQRFYSSEEDSSSEESSEEDSDEDRK